MTSGKCVVSDRLREAGFSFRFPELQPALRDIVHKAHASSPVLGVLGVGAKA
jgi:hypothetical protein